jgi:Cytochrome P450
MISAFVIAATVIIMLVIRAYLFDPFKKIPGPSSYPFIGVLFKILEYDSKSLIHELFNGFATKYGKICRITVLGDAIILISDVESAKKILTDQTKFVRTAEFQDAIADLAPHSLFAVCNVNARCLPATNGNDTVN